MMQSESVSRVLSAFLLALSIVFISPKIYADDQTPAVATPSAAVPAAVTPAATAPALAPTSTPATATPAAADTAPATAAASTDQEIGQVIWVKGDVKAIQGSTPRPLQRRAPIYLHDTIVTDPEGSGEISFTDSSVVTLNSATEFHVDDYNYKKDQPPAQQKSVMSLIKGGFRTITGAVPKENPTGYQVNTPVATIGVRGTDYTVYYDQMKGLSAQINAGIISITNAYGTLQLNRQTLNEIYAQVPLNGPPVFTNKQSDELNKQPGITSTGKGTKYPGGPGGTGGTGGGQGPSSPGKFYPTNSTPGGKLTNNFCISLLRDLYHALSKFFG